MRYFLCLLFALAFLVNGPQGYAEGEVPTYQRQRHGSRGGHPGQHMPGWQHSGYVWPGFGGGFINTAYAGTWYQRPYPYHFDYYRGRFNAPHANGNNVDCPCAQPTVAE